MSRLLGAVLAGGQSRRFGSDKALAELDDRPLIAHAAAALEPFVAEVVICGRVFGDYVALADRPAPGLGPLGGLAAALRHAADLGFDAVLSIGCDMPLLPADLVAALRAIGASVAVRALPICGLWCAGDADRLDAHLADSDDRSMRGWLAACGGQWFEGDIALANINTRADLAALILRRD
ncbi:molybdenum cofactor guanylyltransferase [Sphingomonas sp. AR_OL41]|uniref:molybdenum cofactor guanylyltransferase n=1 Tax=Sphingomonas sp. AR_OL41 TaxID=3042729 RepID=UPI002480832F|nr:molybdenum cofactor guanylyltransferase [Sphingomonas sp. AR_OL41]MDH7971867.1 molybdenum cofactor guanylyltransferase [Sphingomonas sp. AR_OL41]